MGCLPKDSLSVCATRAIERACSDCSLPENAYGVSIQAPIRVADCILKNRGGPPHVIEHAIQHELHTAGVHIGYQAQEVIPVSKFRRDFQKVQGIVFVVCVR